MYKIAVACVTAGVIGLAASQASAALSSTDRTFVEQAASGGMAEVQLGQLAQQRASSPQVKQFGERMVTDHSKANAQLQQIAQQQNVTLPSQMGPKEAAAQKKLSGLNGAAFDQAYSQDMVSDHQQDIALFQKEAKSGQDPALKSFAQSTLPVLQQHLQMAQAMSSNR